jgi:AraC family transcriptional regulator
MNQKREAWSERILKVVTYIQTHLDEDLTPEQLGELAGFSPHHFHRVFRGMLDESVMGYIRRLRLERAAFQLKHGKTEVLGVALQAGYESHEAFTRAFRAQFKVTPSEFRDEGVSGGGAKISFRMEPTRPCIAYRRIGDYLESSEAWATLMGFVMAEPAFAVAAGTPFGLTHDDPEITSLQKCRYDACWPIGLDNAPKDLPLGFSIRTVPRGLYAVTRHEGPYDAMRDAYVTLLGKVLPRRGVDIAPEPVVEIYLNSPMEVAPEALLSEICLRCEPMEEES